MAENTIDSKKPIYNPQYDVPKKPGFKITRRGFLKGAAAVGITGAVAASIPLSIEVGKTQGELQSAYNRKTFESLTDKAEAFITGPINITKESRLRTGPGITPDGIMSNASDWNDVEKINGVQVKTTDKFRLENAPIVEGDNPDGPGKGSWVPVLITKRSLGTLGEPSDSIYYLSLSGTTEQAGVIAMDRDNGARFKKVEKRDGDNILFNDGTKISRKDLNKVITESTIK